MRPTNEAWEMDWQSAQEILDNIDTDPDNRPLDTLDTGEFIQHDFTVAYELNDHARFRAGVINAFDENQPEWLGVADDFDVFGRRFFAGVTLRY
jgi:outer membrane receptor protein involved in Fe transport